MSLRPVPELVLLARIVLRGRSAQLFRDRELRRVADGVVAIWFDSEALWRGFLPLESGHLRPFGSWVGQPCSVVTFSLPCAALSWAIAFGLADGGLGGARRSDPRAPEA